jgi:hypothetical protein
MANNYQHRLDRLEAVIAPKAQYFVWRGVGETNRDAAERYCKANGLGSDIERVMEEGMFVFWIWGEAD